MLKLFDDETEKNSHEPTAENFKEYFRTKDAYEEEIKQARESMRDALKNIVDKYNLPKKEIAIVEQIRKKEADIELINSIIDGADQDGGWENQS